LFFWPFVGFISSWLALKIILTFWRFFGIFRWIRFVWRKIQLFHFCGNTFAKLLW